MRVRSQNVKSLISDLSDRLQAEVPSEVRDTSYRDEETSKATEKKENLDVDTAKHSSTLVSRSFTLDGEISTLQSELDALSKWPLQMDTMRADEGHISAKAKADLTGEITAGKFHHETEDLSNVDSKGLNYQNCEVLFHVNKQSPTLLVVCTSSGMTLTPELTTRVA